MDSGFETSNINMLWLQNIYENLKNLEQMERLAREGCESLLEYIQMTEEQRDVILPMAQYKNMCMIVSEYILLLTDLTPVMDKEKHTQFLEEINKLDKVKDNRELFMTESYNAVKQSVTKIRPTPFFKETISYLSDLKRRIVREIAHVLYIEESKSNARW